MRTNYNYNSPLRPAGSGGRFPYRLALSVLVLVLLLLLGNALRSALDPSVREQQQWEQQRVHVQAEQLAQLNLALAAGWRVLAFVLAGALGVVLVKAAYHRLADRAIVLLDKQARIEQARRLTAPAGVQHLALTYHDSHRNEVIEGQAVEAGALLPAGVPEFGELLRSGRIGAGQPLNLGYGEQGAIEGDWSDLYSVGIGAQQGAGKTWCAAFLLAQSALAGARLIICDPHAGNDESLANRVAPLAPAFFSAVATSESEILAALRLGKEELERRKAQRSIEYPLIIAVDEWSSLLRGELGDELPGYVLDFSEQGRKYKVYALLMAQSWTVEAAGAVRGRLTAHYLMRQRSDEARYQLGMSGRVIPADVPLLDDGQAYLKTTHGQFVRVTIPHLTEADMQAVGARLGGPAPARDVKPFGFQPPAQRTGGGSEMAVRRQRESELTASGSQSGQNLTVEERRIIGLLAEGKTPAEVIEIVYKVKAKAGGREYSRRYGEIAALISRLALAIVRN